VLDSATMFLYINIFSEVIFVGFVYKTWQNSDDAIVEKQIGVTMNSKQQNFEEKQIIQTI